MKKITFLFLFTSFISFAQWNQLGADIDGLVANEQSGTSNDLNADGTVLIVGAPRAMDNGIMTGKARVYEWNGTNWTQRGDELIGSNQGDVFGEAVSISSDGNTIAVGAPGFLNTSYLSPTGPTGYTRIFEWNGTSWIQKGTDINGEAPNDVAGSSISLTANGNRIAIGASSNDGVNGSSSGHCRIYEWNGSAWNQLGSDIDGEAANDFSGSVSINATGTIVAIGASGNDAGGTNTGQVRVYEWNGSSWIQKGTDIDSDNTNASFGYTISLDTSGTTFIAGGYSFVNGALGFVKVFSWDGTDWVQKGETILGTTGSDFFGTAVGISQDGSVIAASSLTLVNGYVRVFKFIGSSWTQQGADILGETNGDQFGRSLSLSANGSILAAGTPFNDGNGTSAGHVRVFENTTLSTSNFENSTISFYPNPTNNIVNFSSPETIEIISLYNLLGQEVLSKEINSNEFKLDISSQPSGTYIAKINSKGKSQLIKLIKL
ncbi:T9SS type A sorting domain-containing protein [Flavobacterium sp.]|uniref:T9SS type A sorting domain-containing protein n=1 Tax=Flavobacterium sp. TaxID=239 RepID=UPI004047A907